MLGPGCRNSLQVAPLQEVHVKQIVSIFLDSSSGQKRSECVSQNICRDLFTVRTLVKSVNDVEPVWFIPEGLDVPFRTVELVPAKTT